MKLFQFLFFLVTIRPEVFSQKPPIDSTAILKWPSLGSEKAISNDGSYFMYTVDNLPTGSTTLIVTATHTKWEREFVGAGQACFSRNAKLIFFRIKDSLFIFSLETDQTLPIASIRSYQVVTSESNDWLAYQLNNTKSELILRSLSTGKEQKFPYITDYSFNSMGSVLLLKSASRSGNNFNLSLQWLDLGSAKPVTIWSVRDTSTHYLAISSYNFDREGRQLVFVIGTEDSTKPSNEIWYYVAGMNRAKREVNNCTVGIKPGTTIANDYTYFNKTGNWIFFNTVSVQNGKANPDAPKVDIWTYHDTMLQSVQLEQVQLPKFVECVNTKDGRVIQLTNRNEKLDAESNDDYIIINDNEYAYGSSISFEPWLNEMSPKYFYLVSLQNGSRTFITKAPDPDFHFSPDGKYLIYFDKREKQYFSYNRITAETCNITKKIPFLLCYAYSDKFDRHYHNEIGLAGWITKKEAVLIYDNFDIWQIDLTGRKEPFLLTNGYGRFHHTKFRLVPSPATDNDAEIFQGNEKLLLSAFNTFNKDNGFFRKNLNEKGDPVLLTMSPCDIFHIQRSNSDLVLNLNFPMPPMKALDSDQWIVRRMTASQAPNYFLTRDFKCYTELSHLQPEQSYNWLTAELIHWKLPDGTESQGILYKPENFNPKKKYPVLFNYYESMSDRLYDYPEPGFMGSGMLNSPLFVSNGYLVCTPDIYYTIGHPGKSACDAIVSAAKFLSTKPWVDRTKMGIQGHSFSGFETNYIITHTHLFAAAAEGAGIADMISVYGGLRGVKGLGASYQSYFEIGQGRMGVTLLERPDLYLENSAIFRANHITTPLLIMHNQSDGSVPWEQGIELFTVLRRLRKSVWLLQYDNGDHVLRELKDSKDYTTRVFQFFDHYLKGMAAPKWMVEGIPAVRKGIDDGLQLEPAGVEPGPGLLIPRDQKSTDDPYYSSHLPSHS
jgi:dienelactone hydrolase